LCSTEKTESNPKIQILFEQKLQEQTGQKSLIHADVLAVVRTMYPQQRVLAEHCLHKELDIKTDIFLPEMQLAIEVNGESHYVAATNQLTPRSYFRNGLLMDLGFSVLTIDHRDWSALKGLQSKKDHIANQLASCLSSRRPDLS